VLAAVPELREPESVQPSFARWYRHEQPKTPPPITTARDRSGITGRA